MTLSGTNACFLVGDRNPLKKALKLMIRVREKTINVYQKEVISIVVWLNNIVHFVLTTFYNYL